MLERSLNAQIAQLSAQRQADAAKRQRMENALSERVRDVDTHRKSATSFKEKIALLEEAYKEQLRTQDKRLRAEGEAEARRLRAYIGLLTEQLEALKSSTTVRRSYLYWSGMQMNGGVERVHEIAGALGLADPSCWGSQIG